MKIECTIKREGGSVHTFGGIEYHFKPEDGREHADPHVAEVTDEDAIARFLSIRESFKPGPGAEVPTDGANDQDGDVNPSDEPTNYLLTNDGTSVDLGKMSKKDLLDWADANKIAVADRRAKLSVLLPAIFEAAIAD